MNEDTTEKLIATDFDFFYDLDLVREYMTGCKELLENISKKDSLDNLLPIAFLFKHSLELISKLFLKHIYGFDYKKEHISVFKLIELINNDKDKDIVLSSNQIEYLKRLESYKEIKEIKFNLSVLNLLIEKYFKEDPTNTLVRYRGKEVDYKKRQTIFTQLKEDYWKLHEIMLILLIIQGESFEKLTLLKKAQIDF